MKKQLYVFFKPFPVVLFVLYVPLVLTFSNCEGSGDQFPAVEEEEPIVQQSSVVQPTECAAVSYYEDWDNDGYGNPNVSLESCSDPGEGYVTDNTDCDDDMYYVNPGMDGMDDNSGAQSNVYTVYLFEEIDNDCDDEVDEDTILMELPPESSMFPQGHIIFGPAP